ncbi:hypothetical protein LUZ60_012122 [Juncus effusus]|nr:hypothetical protein LUZ60_012122 [Juncus effusus]
MDLVTRSTTIVAHNLFVSKDLTTKQKPFQTRFPNPRFIRRTLIHNPSPQISPILAPKTSRLIPHAYLIAPDTKPSKQWPPPNKADDPKLQNPLARLERMGCGWLGVILEFEGVIVENDPKIEKKAWLLLAEEEGKSPPPAFILHRILGMKNEQAISEILCWSKNSSEILRMASRKEEIHKNLQTGYQVRTGSVEFMKTLNSHKIPIAVASTRPRKVLEEAIESTGVRNCLSFIVSADDVHRGKPDPEMFVYAAQLMKYTPGRCIVFGNSNSSVEAAHDAIMKCVAVASMHPVYELGAADLVVNRLDELSVVDLKNLTAVDSPEFEVELELEVEEEEEKRELKVGIEDW